MMKKKLKLKITTVFAVGVLMIALAIFPAIFVYMQFNKISNEWHQYNQHEVAVNESLSQLNRNIGYGGFIHNFKNLILRRDINRYQKAIDNNLVEIYGQIEKIERLVSSPEELNALQEIRVTFDLYRDMYEIVKEMVLINKSPEEIDKVVAVSDTEALKAIETLSSSISQHAFEVANSLVKQESDLLDILRLIIILVFIFIITVIAFLIKYLKKVFVINAQLSIEKENAEKASIAKSKFLSSMSHELYTLMNAIMGFSQLLQLDAKDDEAKAYTQEILNAGDKLLELFREALELSEIESGTVSLSIDSHNLNDLLNESLSIIKPVADKQSIAIDNHVDPLLNTTVNVDKDRFKKILLNLLSNAIKYNRENGNVTIDCSFKDKNMLCLSISDTGKGLTSEQKSHLFKPFDRAGVENSNIAGSGLGLVIAKELIEQMNGTIGFESEVGKGSRFWIQIPCS